MKYGQSRQRKKLTDVNIPYTYIPFNPNINHCQASYHQLLCATFLTFHSLSYSPTPISSIVSKSPSLKVQENKSYYYINSTHSFIRSLIDTHTHSLLNMAPKKSKMVQVKVKGVIWRHFSVTRSQTQGDVKEKVIQEC